MYATLLEALEASARTDKGIHFVESAQHQHFLPYRELRLDALGLLAGLQKLGVRPGDELVLQYADLKGLVTAYWACLAGGIVPVPLEYADKPATAEKVLTVWRELANPWLATDCGKLAGKLEKFALEAGYTERWGQVRERLVFPQREQTDPQSCGTAPVAPTDIAFIQFSSGSTGAPKGVALTHANLLTNIDDLLAVVDHRADDCFLSWKPITHDFGMIAFHLAPIVGGSEQVRISTDAFVWNPSLWFSMASKFRATILGSPNFGYRHLLKLYRRSRARRADWDLSQVRVVLNGAEPISAQLCDEFSGEFAEYGLPATAMRCGYGLAEGSLVVSLCPPGEPVRTVAVDRLGLGVGERLREVDPAAPEAMSLVDCGLALPRTEIRITGAGRVPLPEGYVGHIEIRGGAVTAGYYRNAEATAELISPDGWLDTQDLGALRGARLVVVGRLKEMIISGGVNYFPHDIEQAILRAKGEGALNKFIACGVYNPDRGSEEPLVFVHHKPGDGDFAALAAEVRELVLAAFGLPVAHVVPVRKIPKTTSGKVQRFKLLRDFLAGEFDAALSELGETRVSGVREASPAAAAAQSARTDDVAPEHADIVDRTHRIAARLLGQDQVDLDARFMDLGLSSLRLLTLREQLEKEFGVALDSTSALDFPSVRSLAAYIAQASADATAAAQTTPPVAEPVTDAGRDGVAIIGMACRFPGGAHSPEAFWKLLAAGSDPVGEVAAERWRSDPHGSAELTTRQGGFLDSVDRFDPLFFGISPAEAQAIDPQQRLLLEVCHEAIENSGRNPGDLAGTRTGVFVGISGSDYAAVGRDLGHGTGPYTFTGTMFNTAAGRLSYTFGLQGPSVAVDTACSSSLVAVHQGLRELRAGSCDLVLAGGVSLMLKVDGHVSFSRLNALAASGRCRSFDDSADGYVRGEGCGVVVLKRLRDAERDGDPILAVILGAAVNHNGRSGGLTVPSGPAQERLISDALQDAGVAPADIDYVEAHGSGTRLGDPQELNALARVFAGRGRGLVLGSVKSNLGHLESAAGVAGLIKLVLCLRHGQFAPNLHFRTPNALADWSKVPFQVAAELRPWEAGGAARTAGISSFGINGTNAHLIVREYQAAAAQADGGRTDGSFVFTLAAKSPAGLRQTAQAFGEHPHLDSIPFHALCQTVNRLRTTHPVRLACVAANGEELKRKLLRFAADDKGATAAIELQQPQAEGPVFLFTGQGSCYAGIGRRLYGQNPIFQQAFDRCDELFSAMIGTSLRERAYATGAHPLQDQRVAQALIFAVEYALARVWESLGVRPAAVIGHSIGEYAAACEAGIVTLEEAVCMVALRGAIMQGTPADGAMAGVLADEVRVRALCEAHSDVYVAAVNAAENITVAGRHESIAKLLAQARKQRIFTEPMPMAHAFHSPLMRASAAKLEEGLQGIRFAPPRIAFISTQTGAAIGSAGDIGRSYWSAHLCSPVRFRAALQVALEGGARTFVEIGGTATLSGLGAQNVADPAIAFLPSLRESRDAWEQLNESIAALFQRGHAIDWDAYHGGHYTFVAGLPNTGYHRTRCWYPEIERSADATACALTVETASVAAVEACAPAGASVCAGSITPVAVEAVAVEAVVIEAQAVRSEIKDMVSRVTGVAPSEISDHVHLFSLGVDSLMLVQLDKQVIARYRVDIPLKRFFTDLHTPDKIAAYVYAEMPRELRTAHAQPALPAAVLLPAQTPQAHSAAQALSANVPADVQAIVHAQLDIMREQLALLRGGTSGDAAVPAGHRPRRTDRAAGAGVQPAARAKTNLRDITLHEEDVNVEQLAFVRDLVSRVNRMTPQSKAYAQRHRAGFADWIATLNFSLTMKELAYPIVSTRSRGARIWDIDGNEYIDTAIGYGVSFFGHNPDFIVEALGEQLQQGIELGPQSSLAGEVAELVRSLTRVERVAFCNTGTEAVMVALRLARTVTKRSKIVRFITSFHGSFDGVLAEASESGPVPMAPGIPQSMVDDTVVLHYGSPESLETIRAMGDELAAVLVEPVQSRNPGLQPREYLQDLRRITAQAGIALIFDEMVTGFRIHPGGAQAYFGVRADLVTYGKIVGGGMPIGIVAGRADYLDAIDGGTWNFNDASGPSKETTFFAGTFCKHPLAMAAARAVLKKLAAEGPALIDAVSELTRRFVDEVNAFCQAEGVPIQVKRFGSMYRFETRVSRDLPRLSLEMNLFFRLMLLHGIYVWERRTCFFSTAHTEEDAQRILHAVKQSVCELRAGGFSFRAGDSPDGDGRSSGAPQRCAPPPPVRDPFPLSSEERRVYVLSQMRGGETAYHVTGALRIDGDLDAAKVHDIFRTLAARHAALRTAYVVKDGEIVHQVQDGVTVALEHYESTQADLPVTIAQVVRPFQLAQAPLWRIGLIRCGGACQVLVFDFHHLIADGTSMSILIEEFLALYQGGELVPVASTYADFVAWERALAAGTELKSQKDYWRNRLEPLPAPLALPCDFPRPPHNDFAGFSVHFALAADTTRAVRELAKQAKATPFMVLLAAYFAFLHKLTRQNDLCVGTPFDRRSSGAFDGTIGMFAQTLIIRAGTDGATPFAELLAIVKQACTAAYAHPDCPLDELLQELAVARDFSRNPLFDTLFIYERGDRRVFRTDRLQAQTLPVDVGGAAFDLTLEISEEREVLHCSFIAARRLFAEHTVRGWASQFENLLSGALAVPDTPLGELQILSEEERDRLLRAFNATERTYPAGQTVHSLFRESAARFPQRVAVRFDDHEMRYAQLDAASDALAQRLLTAGVATGDRVGILLRRGPSLIVSMLAALKAGAAYVPLDPDYPAARLRYMLERSEAKALLGKAELAAALEFDGTLIDPDAKGGAGDVAPAGTAGPEDLAYVIFTSGSTGHPKGVMIEHRNVVNFIHGMREALALPEHPVTLGLTTVSFDIFVLEVFLTFAAGGTLVLASEATQRDPKGLTELIQRTGTCVVQITPSRLQMLLASQSAQRVFSGVQVLLVGGEAFPAQALPALAAVEGLRTFNVYGPTETTVWSSFKELSGTQRITLGKPIANTRMYVLGAAAELLPTGCVGDLYIAGAGLARGYLNDERATAAAFKPDPFVPGERMYRTGDHAAWTAEGELVCHGRSDEQIKLRGYRIELAEIESVLRAHAQVKHAAVAVRELGPGNPALVAYCIPAAGPLGEAGYGEALRTYVAQHLPEHMVPAVVVAMETLPSTPNGKLDRNALPAPVSAPPPIVPATEDAADELEGQIVQAWKQVLGERPIGPRDSFFDVGGNSLSLVLMHSALAQKYPGVLEVADVFANPTVAALKRHLRDRLAVGERAAKELVFPSEFFRTPPQPAAAHSLHVELAADWSQRMHAAAQAQGCDASELALAVYLLYLSKLLEADTVAMPAAVDRNVGYVPVEIDFRRGQGLGAIVRTLQAQRGSSGASMQPPACRRGHERGVLPLFASGSSVGATQRHGFDLVLQVGCEADRLRIELGCDCGRLSEARLQRFLADYVKLIKVVVGAAAAPVPGSTEPVALRAA